MGQRMSNVTVRPARCEAGFSMVELAVAIAVVAFITWAVSAAYGNTGHTRDRARAQALGEMLRENLRAYALANARLPCPDVAATGWEGDATGACAAGAVVGWFPYRSVGLEVPSDGFRALYAVYRHAVAPDTADADLAVRKERTNDLAGSGTFQDVHDFIQGLRNAAAETATPVAARAITTGAADCTAGPRSNPAFWLVLPLQDSDGNGSPFDGLHSPTSVCAFAPDVPSDSTRDDVVLAEPFSVLAGWLHARTP